MSRVDKIICDNCQKQRPPKNNDDDLFSYDWIKVSYNKGCSPDKDFCSEACFKEFYKDK